MRVHSATVISQARNDGTFSPSILLLIKSSFKLLSNTYKSARVMRALRPSTKSPRGSIVPGGVYAGHGIAATSAKIGGAIHTFGQCAARKSRRISGARRLFPLHRKNRRVFRCLEPRSAFCEAERGFSIVIYKGGVPGVYVLMVRTP